MRKILQAVFVCATALPAVASGVGEVRGDETWKKIENEYFSFSAPPLVRNEDVRGIDSFVAEYAGDRITIHFDYGMYSNNFQDWPKDTTYEETKIDGKAARIGTTKSMTAKDRPYRTKVYIDVSRDEALSMSAACKSKEDVATAKKIFATLVFKKK